MDVRALGGTSGQPSSLEGKIESVKDGKALVRLSGGTSVDVPVERDFPVGAPVRVGVASDGSLSLTLRGPDLDLATLRQRIETALLSLVGEDLAKALAAPLAKGDLQSAAKLLPSLSSATSASLEASGNPAPTFLSAPSSTGLPSGEVLLAVVGKLGDNLYAAEAAGKGWTLQGPSDVPVATRIVAQAWSLPEGTGIWTPAASNDVRWAGVPEATPEERSSLGEALAEAARRLLADLPADPGTTPSPSSSASGPDIGTARTAPGPLEPVEPGISAEAPVFPEDAVRPAPVRESATGEVGPEQARIRPPEVEDRPGRETLRSRETESRPEPVRATESAPRDTSSSGRIPSQVAVRVLAAWATGLPGSDGVARAVTGAVQDLPAALADLEREVRSEPGRHPRLEAALARVRESGLPAASAKSDVRRELEAAVLETLRTKGSRGEDASATRRAAESLLADRLPDSQGAGTSHSHWTAGAQPGQARIVVRDERGARGRTGAPDGHHAVEISMDPPGLGEVGARLELRGRILTTRLEAADPATVELVRSRIQELSSRLSALGLEPGGLEVRQRPEKTAAAPRRREAGGSLDVRA